MKVHKFVAMKTRTLFLSVALIIVLLLVAQVDLSAQCAMCTATAETSNDAGSSAAHGLNKGVMYLFLTPYIIIGTLAYFWRRSVKKAQQS